MESAIHYLLMDGLPDSLPVLDSAEDTGRLDPRFCFAMGVVYAILTFCGAIGLILCVSLSLGQIRPYLIQKGSLDSDQGWTVFSLFFDLRDLARLAKSGDHQAMELYKIQRLACIFTFSIYTVMIFAPMINFMIRD